MPPNDATLAWEHNPIWSNSSSRLTNPAHLDLNNNDNMAYNRKKKKKRKLFYQSTTSTSISSQTDTRVHQNFINCRGHLDTYTNDNYLQKNHIMSQPKNLLYYWLHPKRPPSSNTECYLFNRPPIVSLIYLFLFILNMVYNSSSHSFPSSFQQTASQHILPPLSLMTTLTSQSLTTPIFWEPNDPEAQLLKLIVNDHTGRVYVGGKNKIYQLSSSLKLETQVDMGPHSECYSSRTTCADHERRLLPYYNKALVIFSTQSTPYLISCGTSFQGSCALHNLDNITHFEMPSNESVVANNPSASTVVYIAPGPTKQSLSRQQSVLYVGSAYSGNGLYYNEVPAVSSRSLYAESLFAFASSNVASGTRLTINTDSRERFPINYIHGFASRGFSYFLTVQRKSANANRPFISKLVRICQKDINYHSYVEVPLICKTESGIDYNLAQAAYVGTPGTNLAISLGITQSDEVLFVVFARSKDERDIYNEPSHSSALCVYALPYVHKIFTRNIQHCFNGNGNQGLDFMSPTESCIATQVQITDDFCGMDVNNFISGSLPIETSPVRTYSNILLTSVVASPTYDFTVAFLGTSEGHLKRLVIEDAKLALEYSDTIVDPENMLPINADMKLDANGDSASYIYAMNEKKIALIKVQECDIHRTCSDCLGAHNPYCGWCSLENRCSLRSSCIGATQDALYWLSYRSGKCTTITSVNPSQIQRTTTRTLTLAIDNLPQIEGQILCAFTFGNQGKTEMTGALRSVSGITCPTPPTDILPQSSSLSHDIVTKLSVRIHQGPDFVATNFTFFDCSSYTTCTQCVSSPYPCDWCVVGHRCTHDTGENCRNDVLVTGVKSIGPSIRSGPKFCPRVNTTHGTNEILVSSGLPRRIQVQVYEIPPAIVSNRFVCQFNIEGRVRQVNAQLLGETVYCDPMEFTYSATTPNVSAAFAVIWDGSKPLDNPDNIHISVYSCSAMASNCGFCLELAEKYQCGWCIDQGRDQGSCQIQEHCRVQQPNMFLTSSDTCPNPQIYSIKPTLGPFEGGTNITIKGINLGRNFEDIQNGVTLELFDDTLKELAGSIPCVPFRELYIKTVEITCQVGSPSNSTSPREISSHVYGHIMVKVTTDHFARSKERFSFVNPKILSIIPSKGPRSGGTKLVMWGIDMDAGSHVEAEVGNSPCTIISRKASVIECITGRSDKSEQQLVSIKFDYGQRSFPDYNFLYVEDPEIDSVSSSHPTHSTFSRNTLNHPKGIPAGGIMVYVKGKNLMCIQEPRLYVIVDGIRYNSSCQIETASEMKCPSPSVPQEKLDPFKTSPEDPIELDYGFFMDSVDSVHHLASRRINRLPMFLMYVNPEYKPFSEENHIKYYNSKSDYLTINGRDLDRATSDNDVIVKIGNGICNVTSLSRTQLTCRPPPIQPQALTWVGTVDVGKLPDVTVTVGNSLNFTIGKLSYDSLEASDRLLPKPLLVIVIVGSCLLIVMVIIILIAYKRKSSESNRVVKTMQEQMDVLEMKVASEAKQAFTELQTEMTDLTDDLEAGGIPYLDYRIYTMKVLFPNIDDHPVLSEMQVDPAVRDNLETGLRLFGQLMQNKTFLLLFIRTLESNRYFSMRDRVNVASLIMVTLQGKMEYCTDILKTLLAELIEKSMESRSHPKLLLRRTESVAEKMLSSWFTFLLYKFLRECAGEPLFLMYQSIKHQVNKGPVDSITNEARCSLSEEKLIRQSIDYKPLTVFVSISTQTAYLSGVDLQTENLETPVKVLDCDTISQVKEKAIDAIYKSTPYSQRLSKESLDLEWSANASIRIIMSDEDHTSKSEGEWRRLNTLAHYRVPDGANLRLVTRQNSLYGLTLLSDKYDKQHRYETLNFGFGKACSPPMSRATSPLNNDADNGCKYWHLVRHHDNDYKEGERSGKMVSEIYLTRLLATKGTLQRFVDDLFETIFSTAGRGSSLPLAIKYMFDFLDDQARSHGIMDPEVVHTWKSNSLPLRFWVNLIKNPNFVFDINKANIVDSCLSVVAQTFMDACSTSEHRLGKDSPSSKLLYAKDIPIYKDWVERYYNDIGMMPPISEYDMNAMLAEESRQHAHEFNTNVSLNELFKYAIKYKEQLIQTLEEDEFARKGKLSAKLQQVMLIMNGDNVL